MRQLLLLFMLCFSVSIAQAQTGFLFVKKGAKKKKTYREYDRVTLQLGGDTLVYGMITRLANDTIFVAGRPVPRTRVKAVVLRDKRTKKQFHIDAKTFLLITGGVALTTAGLTLSNQAEFKEALTAGLTIGYAPLLLNYIGSKISLGRKKFKIGKKYRLQVLDFYLPRKRAF